MDEQDVTLARPSDSRQIGAMSRVLVESGLGWRWTPRRILAVIRDPEHNVALVRKDASIAGFGIMRYGFDEAHLLLFAVRPEHRRRRLGAMLLRWLEETAVVAGVGAVHLETRESNPGARRFYLAQGYSDVGMVPGYYDGREAAVRMVRRLRPDIDGGLGAGHTRSTPQSRR